jgi:hypothetical protein
LIAERHDSHQRRAGRPRNHEFGSSLLALSPGIGWRNECRCEEACKSGNAEVWDVPL